jgi:hypothetical protein
MTVSLAQGSGSGAGNGNAGGNDPGNAGNNGGGNGGQPNGSAGNQNQGSNNGDFFAGLSPENREFATKKNWKGLDDAFKSHRELEAAFSSRSPGKEYSLGDYAFTAPKDADKIGYSKDNAEAFRQFAHKNKLSPEQAAAVHDMYVNNTVEGGKKAAAAKAEALNAKFEASSKALEKSWGVPDSPGFKRNVEMAFRSVRELGIQDALVEVGALVKGADGKMSVANATIVEALAKVGAAMYAEDNMYGNVSSDANPFAMGTAHENATKAGQIMRDDPEKAEMLIRAAGPEVAGFYEHWLANRKK